MRTLTVKIESMKDLIAAAVNAGARAERGAVFEAPSVLSFDTWEAMHRTLAPKRTGILVAMAGRGPLTVRQVAALVGRDIKNVHGDLDMLPQRRHRPVGRRLRLPLRPSPFRVRHGSGGIGGRPGDWRGLARQSAL
jgi:Predicted transcriptional regulator